MLDSTLPPLSALTRLLACAALSPGLRSILLFDIHPETFSAVTGIFTEMLEVIGGHEITQMTMGAIDSDDDLWGSLVPSDQANELPLIWQPSMLTKADDSRTLHLIIIPNLARQE